MEKKIFADFDLWLTRQNNHIRKPRVTTVLSWIQVLQNKSTKLI